MKWRRPEIIYGSSRWILKFEISDILTNIEATWNGKARVVPSPLAKYCHCFTFLLLWDGFFSACLNFPDFKALQIFWILSAINLNLPSCRFSEFFLPSFCACLLCANCNMHTSILSSIFLRLNPGIQTTVPVLCLLLDQCFNLKFKRACLFAFYFLATYSACGFHLLHFFDLTKGTDLTDFKSMLGWPQMLIINSHINLDR